jgi:hypothetical protein
MVGQPERRYHDIVWVVSNLYASRIHVGLQTCGDGLRIWISDRLFKTRADHSVSALGEHHYHLEKSAEEAALWLHQRALLLFPDSDYARQSSARGLGTASARQVHTQRKNASLKTSKGRA